MPSAPPDAAPATAPVRRARGFTPGGARLIVAAVAAACGTVILCLPAGVPPQHPPPIWPDAAEAALPAALAADVELARAAESYEGRAVGRLRRLYAEQGLAEVGGGEDPNATHERSLGSSRLLALVEAEHAAAARALRAEALVELWPALRGELGLEREREILGSFARILERYGAAVDGRRVAPRSVLRVMYAARWNVIHGLERTEGFTDAEAQAYWGWAALHAPVEGPRGAAVREEAMREYAACGGPDADALRAYVAYGERAFAQASALYQRLFESTGALRYRNHAGRRGARPPRPVR